MAQFDSDERDRHTLRVAGHGIAPDDMPSVAGFDEIIGGADASGAPGSGSSHTRGRGAHRAPSRGDGTGIAGVTDAANTTDRNGGGSFSWKDTLIWCGIPILVVVLIRVFLIGFYEIPTRSMESTIEPGDRVVTLKIAPRVVGLQRGDVVVFHDPANWLAGEQTSNPLGGDYLIKRLIGLPGDVVACKGAGQPITVNGVAIDESAYLKAGVQPSAFPFSVTVTEGHVFVMGDNRGNSADSRYHQDDGDHGLVPVSDVVGVGLARYWPLNRLGALDAHNEVFADVPGVSSVTK
ncbi:signal peptidase I [Bifidobacterium saguinibicoloris]|uniref:signal peptidase I n=1 Tax=Bifidobacterium saguinibicoloris TaxID=2834433 RepID=UPI001C59436E|nr:signal peptidase I [Bifidobacterium saguinibicoloris]MBW3080180.1 signal peptidase I [Bifidobacterium saguinibicoloris]